jgi:hypothetical protein
MEKLSQLRNGRFEWPRKPWITTARNTVAEEPSYAYDSPA